MSRSPSDCERRVASTIRLSAIDPDALHRVVSICSRRQFAITAMTFAVLDGEVEMTLEVQSRGQSVARLVLWLDGLVGVTAVTLVG